MDARAADSHDGDWGGFPWTHGTRNAEVGFRDQETMFQWLPRGSPVFRLFHDIHLHTRFRRKEFLESICVLERLWPVLLHWRHIIEVSAGHGLFGMLAAMLVPGLETALLSDRRKPANYSELLELIARHMPYVKRRVRYVERPLHLVADWPDQRFVVAIHGCGALSDHIAERAWRSGCSFALVPCCMSPRLLAELTGSPLEQRCSPWTPEELMERIMPLRVQRISSWGYAVFLSQIPPMITPFNHILLALRPEHVPYLEIQHNLPLCPLPPCGPEHQRFCRA